MVQNATQQKDGFAVMSALLGTLSALRSANGDAPMPAEYYSPLLMLDASGAYTDPGGGVSAVGGDVGVGDYAYAGIFIHEQGHALGLPHAGEAYDIGRYPYAWGSLKGSAWGYDAFKREFLAPTVPSNASSYPGCATNTFAGHARAVDNFGHCIKQDPMQSGAGDEAAGYKFATFSDFNTAVMQRYLEGTTNSSGGSAHIYSGGKIVPDTAFAGGYKRWDGLDLNWINVTPTTQDNAIYGFDQGLPVQRDVPVYSIAITYSNAGTAGASQIYTPLSYIGNLMRTIDPTDAAQRASIVPDTSANAWYCRNGGCDYTVRVTYANGKVRHALVQGGFRPFNQARGTPSASATDPLNSSSFRTWVVNFPNDASISRVE